MFCRTTVVGFVLTLVASVAAAEEMTLGELIGRFNAAQYSLVYSTGLVDENLAVEWNEGLSIQGLRALLQRQGLTLQDIGRRQWAITRAVVVPKPGNTSSGEDAESTAAGEIVNIVVNASRYELLSNARPSTHVIDSAQLNDIPSFGGDSLRVVHRLPGAASIGVSSRPNVRGGGQDELLVLFDGVELLEPFHLRDFQSMFSSFHPQTIRHIEYFTGGFPAQYGNKLSGVLDIATQDGFEAPGGEIGISAYWSSALYFDEWGDNQALISFRRGNVDLILDVVNPDLGEPRYYDLYARFVREFSKGRFKSSAFIFDDDIRFMSDEERATSKVSNQYFWLEWEAEHSLYVYSRTIFAIGEVDSQRFGESFSDRAIGTLVDDRLFRTINLKHLQEIRPTARTHLNLGVSLIRTSMQYNSHVMAERGDIAELLGQPLSIDFHRNMKYAGNSVSAHATGKFELSDMLTMQLGLRYDRQSFAATDSQWSPRIALLYRPDEKWRLRFSYGQFHQPHEIHELRTVDRETRFEKPQRADHWIVAAEYLFGTKHRIQMELFYKDIENPLRRYENLFDPYRFVPELQPDRIPIVATGAFSRSYSQIWCLPT